MLLGKLRLEAAQALVPKRDFHERRALARDVSNVCGAEGAASVYRLLALWISFDRREAPRHGG
jgi:hypothetical protein